MREFSHGPSGTSQIEAPRTSIAGRYRIVSELGRGAMGWVARAVDELLQREVAIKFMIRDADPGTMGRQRFLREAQALARLSHSGIVQIYDVGYDADGSSYLVMEFLRGTTLGEFVTRRGREAWPTVHGLIAQMLVALEACHRAGVIHRDLKPANCLVTGPDERPQLKVLDFGIARVHGAETLTAPNTVCGTLLYMAPEQAAGLPVDSRADLYAVASIVYALLTGRPPFEGDTTGALLAKIVHAPAPALSDGLEDPVPPAVESWLTKALAKSPDERFADASTMLAAWQPLDWPISMASTARLDRVVPSEPPTPQKPAARIVADDPATPSWAVDAGTDAWGRWAMLEYGPARQRMRWIPAGSFMVGSSSEDPYARPDECPRHRVELSHGFWLADTSCAQDLWLAGGTGNPSHFRGPRRPVESVSWQQIQSFLERSSQAVGASTRLPTEAQWEYACRGPAPGDPAPSLGDGMFRAPGLDDVAWYGGNCGVGYDHPDGIDLSHQRETRHRFERGGPRNVGGLKPNGFGLYDMLGNVYEWCEDGLRDYGSSPDPACDPRGDEREERAIRGGAWDGLARTIRASARDRASIHAHSHDLGFRICILDSDG